MLPSIFDPGFCDTDEVGRAGDRASEFAGYPGVIGSCDGGTRAEAAGDIRFGRTERGGEVRPELDGEDQCEGRDGVPGFDGLRGEARDVL